MFPLIYKCLNRNSYKESTYEIVPIRYQDRFVIMKWRNEQMYHLRQSKTLTEDDQERYFSNVVAHLFDKEQPEQILFSYLKNDVCIGYGGLVHINWTDKNAEISFIMNTALEKEHFHFNWRTYLGLLEKVAFAELGLHKVYTYAFDLRPHLYEALESSGFLREAKLKEHCSFQGHFRDVVIHSQLSPYFLRALSQEDKALMYHWANDPDTRNNSFSIDDIPYEKHSSWFDTKLHDSSATYYMCFYKGIKSGIVRFDRMENHSLVGINIAPEQRKKGLSSVFLQLATRMYFEMFPEAVILAFIKKSNIASVKSFEKAGFQFLEKKMHDSDEVYVYNLLRK